MSDKIDDDSFNDEEDDELDEQLEMETKEISLKAQIDARRRLEQLKEDRELERMLKDDYYY